MLVGDKDETSMMPLSSPSASRGWRELVGDGLGRIFSIAGDYERSCATMSRGMSPCGHGQERASVVASWMRQL